MDGKLDVMAAGPSGRPPPAVWWYLRRGHSQRAIARTLKISLGTVSYYKRLGIPDYDWSYDPDRRFRTTC